MLNLFMIKTKFLFSIFVFTIIIASTPIKSQSLKILPIGNSITQLDINHFSYRYPLWKMLIDDEVDFDYVGSMTKHWCCGIPVFPNYNGHTFDTDHEGHGGWTCDDIINGGDTANCCGTGYLSLWLNNYTPDIALIHLGTNDMIHDWNNGQGVAETINELKDIINLLRADNPQVIVLLAKLIPADGAIWDWASHIDSLNAEIPSIATDMQSEDSPIIIVDQYTGFDPTLGNDTFDGIHPNASGEEKMAQKWHDAIQNALAGSGFGLQIKTYLEGPYDGGQMSTNILAELPLQQPYNVSPWNYPGTEAVESLPSPSIVDWILVELRDTTDASFASESTRIARRAAFLLHDGSIVGMDGSSNLAFYVSINDQLFVVIHHQNHLPVMSANALTENSGVYSYDFSTAANKAYGSSQNHLGDGNFGMIAGDFNADGMINLADLSIKWNLQAGLKGYYRADANLNSNVDNSDKNDFWNINQGLSSTVP
jgi:lysophospholipase L1-like esterase